MFLTLFFLHTLFLIRFLYRWDLAAVFTSLWFCYTNTNHWAKTWIFLIFFLCVCVLFFGSRGEQIRFCFCFFSPYLFLIPIDNMKLFLQLVPGIIFKQILFFFSFKLSVTFAHLPFFKKTKTQDHFMKDILISISILSLLPPSFLIIVRHLFPLDTLPTTGQPAPIWFGSFFHIGWLSSRVLKIYHSLNSFQVEARTLSVSPTLVQCQTHSRTSINVYWMTSQILDISVHRK